MPAFVPTRVRRFAIPALSVVAAALLTACSDAPPSESATSAPWTVAPDASVTVGRDDGPDAVLLERITGASRLPDGRILVADLGETPLRMFGADGQFAAAVAREGGGPGEYRYLARLFTCGDSLYAYDIDGHRVSVLTREGGFVRSFRFPVPEGQQVPYHSACNAAGRWVHIGWGTRRTVAGVHRDTVPLWVARAAEGQPAVVDSIPASERWGQTYEGRVVGSRPLPFGKQPHLAAGRTRLYAVSGDGDTVRVFDLDGVPLQALVAELPPAPVLDADIRAVIETEVLSDGEQYRRGIEREFSSIAYPATHAPITALLVDARDHLWVRGYAPPQAAVAPWRVFSPEGNLVTTVEMPGALEVLEIGEDYVLGRTIDPGAGVPLLQLHALTRTSHR